MRGYCRSLLWEVTTGGYHGRLLQEVTVGGYCRRLPWECTTGVYHGRLPQEFSLPQVFTVRVYCRRLLLKFTMGVYCRRLPQEFTTGVYCVRLPWEFTVGGYHRSLPWEVLFQFTMKVYMGGLRHILRSYTHYG